MWYHYDITFVLGCQEVLGENASKSKIPSRKNPREGWFALRFFSNHSFVSVLNKLFDSWVEAHKYHKRKRQGTAYGKGDIQGEHFAQQAVKHGRER